MPGAEPPARIIGVLELLAACADAFGPSGFEEPAREVVRRHAEQIADEVSVDAAGNLVARLRGGEQPPVVLTAHLDEVGFMVSHVEEDGFLRVAPIGGWKPVVLPAQRISFATASGDLLTGVVATLPPHVSDDEDTRAPPKLRDLAIDVGAAGTAEVADLGLDVGSPGVPATRLERLSGDAVAAKALDDRAGCVAVLEALRALADARPSREVVAAFTTSEERDGAGAAHFARSVDAELVLVVETTVAADLPGIPRHRHVTRVGRGPALTVMDRRWTAPPDVVDALRRTAADIGVPVQTKLPLIGGTDAATWREERPELPCGIVSTPCRGIHSASGVLRLGDLAATARLIEAAARRRL
jgi:putative aminopeptidase FrvX